MKRDMDLVRAILLNIETNVPPEGTLYQNAEFEPFVEGYEYSQFLGHLELMDKAGLIEANIVWTHDGGSSYRIDGLTWAGYDFLENIRDASRWEKTLNLAKEKAGSLSLEVVMFIAKQLAIEAARGLF